MAAAPKDWFSVDKKGLAQLLEQRGRAFAVLELVSNAWDQNITRVDVTLTPTGVRAKYELVVTDDDPDGFADLTHAFTLFAPSNKKGDATKRGRFNLGEKLVLAISDEATISSTTGAVRFDDKGRTSLKTKRAVGSEFRAIVHLTKPDFDKTVAVMGSLLPPRKIVTTFNGEVLAERTPAHTFKARLLTEVADNEDNMRTRVRSTTVELYDPLPGEVPAIYELGIRVVENGDRWHYNVCVAPGTRILTADLRYVLASTIEPGMKLVGFDEERSPDRRKLATSEVKDVQRVVKPCYRLTFDDGTTVICSTDHQWLTLRHGTNEGHGRTSRWLTTEAMRPMAGGRAGSVVAKPFDTWFNIETPETGYLAAAFDGEGCLVQTANTNPAGVRNVLEFTQVDNLMLDKVRVLLDQLGIGYREQRQENAQSDAWKPVVHLQISGRADIVRLLGMIRPVRLLPKFTVEGLGTLPTRRGARLVTKEFLGDREVIAIETSTHTFIAEGLASHNCQKIPLEFNVGRDNVKPEYLRTVRTLVLNEMFEKIDQTDANATWTKEGIEDSRITGEALKAVLDLRFGEKVVSYDPSDQEANNIAISKGYTVVHGRSLSKQTWENVRQHEFIKPAGQITPSNTALMQKHFSEEGDQHEVSEDKWTPAERQVVAYAKALSIELLGFEVNVTIVSDIGLNAAAYYGSRSLTFNVGRLGHAWFNALDQAAVDALLIHEFTHERVSNHLAHEFHDEACRLGAKMRHVKATL